MALVTPEERAAASGLTASVRALAQACAPVVAGATMAVAATPAPFLLAGGLKIVYDLSLYFRFRAVALPNLSGTRAETNGGNTRPSATSLERKLSESDV